MKRHKLREKVADSLERLQKISEVECKSTIRDIENINLPFKQTGDMNIPSKVTFIEGEDRKIFDFVYEWKKLIAQERTKKYMKLTKKERELIRKSITHWNRDIISKFKEGLILELDDKLGYIWSDGGKLLDTDASCPLCIEFLSTKTECYLCPYYKFYGASCDNESQFYNIWAKNRTLLNAELMRDSLKAIIKGEI